MESSVIRPTVFVLSLALSITVSTVSNADATKPKMSGIDALSFCAFIVGAPVLALVAVETLEPHHEPRVPEGLVHSGRHPYEQALESEFYTPKAEEARAWRWDRSRNFRDYIAGVEGSYSVKSHNSDRWRRNIETLLTGQGIDPAHWKPYQRSVADHLLFQSMTDQDGLYDSRTFVLLARDEEARLFAELLERLTKKKALLWTGASTFDEYLVTIAKELSLDESDTEKWLKEAKIRVTMAGIPYLGWKPYLESTATQLAAASLLRIARTDFWDRDIEHGERCLVTMAKLAPFGFFFAGEEGRIAMQDYVDVARFYRAEVLAAGSEIKGRTKSFDAKVQAQLVADQFLRMTRTIQ